MAFNLSIALPAHVCNCALSPKESKWCCYTWKVVRHFWALGNVQIPAMANFAEISCQPRAFHHFIWIESWRICRTCYLLGSLMGILYSCQVWCLHLKLLIPSVESSQIFALTQ